MEFLELKNILIKNLKIKKLIKDPLQLTLDTNIQHIIDEELKSSALRLLMLLVEQLLLMNVNNGEVLSLVSLPNFNINTRENILIKTILIK